MSNSSGTLIRVGQSEYRGPNLLRLCFDEDQAIRVLRNRGVSEEEAKGSVRSAMLDGYAHAYDCHSHRIEVTNEAYAFEHGWYKETYEEIERHWAKSSEH